MKLSPLQILLLRLAIAGLFLTLGAAKYREGWLTGSAPLTESLGRFAEHAGGVQSAYLKTVAIPLAPLWSRAIVLGELAVGVSLLLGLLTRLSSAAALFMVANFHAANGNLFSWSFFGTPSAALLAAGLLVIFLARGGRWAGIDAYLATLSGKSALW